MLVELAAETAQVVKKYPRGHTPTSAIAMRCTLNACFYMPYEDTVGTCITRDGLYGNSCVLIPAPNQTGVQDMEFLPNKG